MSTRQKRKKGRKRKANTRIAGQARAKIAIDSVLAGTTVGARIGIAFVNIGFTARARESRKTVQIKANMKKLQRKKSDKSENKTNQEQR
jgi:hypothetical protein